MMLLVSGTVPRIGEHPYLGQLVTVDDGNRVLRRRWGLDNSAFTGFEPDKYRSRLAQIAGTEGCLFATVPDVVGDHDATLELWHEWIDEVEGHGYPPAFVGQDGATPENVPWDRMSAFFIGGTDEYKLGSEAADTAAEARQRGLWVHMGRVNSETRIRHAYLIGCDSFDGGRYSMYSQTYIPRTLRQLEMLDRQLELFA